MPKCRKRIVCKEPDTTVFLPEKSKNNELLTMTVDEYESIRLIDLEGFSQEECAHKLGVARTTAQLIYNHAREKLAKALVHRSIIISQFCLPIFLIALLPKPQRSSLRLRL